MEPDWDKLINEIKIIIDNQITEFENIELENVITEKSSEINVLK